MKKYIFNKSYKIPLNGLSQFEHIFLFELINKFEINIKTDLQKALQRSSIQLLNFEKVVHSIDSLSIVRHTKRRGRKYLELTLDIDAGRREFYNISELLQKNIRFLLEGMDKLLSDSSLSLKTHKLISENFKKISHDLPEEFLLISSVLKKHNGKNHNLSTPKPPTTIKNRVSSNEVNESIQANLTLFRDIFKGQESSVSENNSKSSIVTFEPNYNIIKKNIRIKLFEILPSLEKVYGQSGIPVIAFQEHIDTGLEFIYTILKEMITKGEINGYIDHQKTISDISDDIYYTQVNPLFYCEMCKKSLTTSEERVQCDKCDRYLCVDCYNDMRKVKHLFCPYCGNNSFFTL